MNNAVARFTGFDYFVVCYLGLTPQTLRFHPLRGLSNRTRRGARDDTALLPQRANRQSGNRKLLRKDFAELRKVYVPAGDDTDNFPAAGFAG
jgi:hypothetical protein